MAWLRRGLARRGQWCAAGAAQRRGIVVDTHTHFLPLAWPDWEARFGGEAWPWMRPNLHGDPTRAMLMQGEEEFRPVLSACWDVAKRVEDMDRDGVDHQIISATPILFQWHRKAEEALVVAQHFNDAALEMSAQAGGRMSALCQVPLQDGLQSNCRRCCCCWCIAMLP
mmetsp:Transcript_30962/g.89952  ORF Transcript_30962/g.89952 Transcript_30962/m.89952 type:complete len:168 (+) Transcript_30962:27-530(+)